MPARPQNGTNVPLTYQQNSKVFDMPNVASAVVQEIQRIELEIIKEITGVIQYDFQDYQSIDYMKNADPVIDRRPVPRFYEREFSKILDEVRSKIAYDDKTKKQYSQYFRKYFKLTYDAQGIPILRFSIPVSDNSVSDDLQILNANVNITRLGGQGDSIYKPT